MSPPVTEERQGAVAVVRLNRPEARNVLTPELMQELASALERLDSDEGVRAIVVAGSEEVFASGPDVGSLPEHGGHDAVLASSAAFWDRLGAIGTPTVAATSGWALGGGCELALQCDMVVAAERTQLGQPEVTLGVIPGGGATQRLTRAIGKHRAMELILTGRRFSAEQAAAWGLVNRVTRRADWLEGALDLAAEVAARAPIATGLAKRAILAAEQMHLEEGLQIERACLEQAMATEDRIEGINAFVQGRKPEFQGR